MTTDDTGRIAQAMPDYQIEREAGRGGMGVVFLARHKRLDRGVAVKELPPGFASDPEVRERFSTEARTLAGLSHPHIVPIFDYVEREGLCLIVMEQLPGGTVWDRFTTTGLMPPTACAVVMACCAALQYAHDKGVLHLDVKPDNLMFDAESAVKVTDFGIAKVISGDRTLGTVDGQVLGTPAYMSPEQARGDELTTASDVYAAGVMLYELLSGQLPWQGATTATELLQQRLLEDPTPLRDLAPHVPQVLADAVMMSLSRDVADRYERAEDFGVAIGEACANAWGPDWLDQAGVAIVGSERLTIAARTTGGRPLAPAPAPDVVRSSGQTRSGETIAGDPSATATPGAHETMAGEPLAAPSGAHETMAGEAAAGLAPDVETSPDDAVADEPVADGGVVSAPDTDEAETVPPSSALPAFEVMRAAEAPRIQGADLADLEAADLIGVEDVLNPPGRPWVWIALSVGLLVATLVVAFTGVGEPDRSETLTAGQVTVAGVDVAGGEPVEIDLSADVPVVVTDAELAATADEVVLEFSYFGIPVSSPSARLFDGLASVDPGLAQRLVGGSTTATVILSSGDQILVEHEVGVEGTHSRFLTLPFIVGMLIVLLAVANLESSLKPLANGHSRLLSSIGALISGAMAGVGLVLVSGALGFAEPT
ncbi:MAG TPA: protein kinase, partial [Acidimicrobiales bacterium]|nr:protein kinase [Acidimicrobiales bacterium]